MNHTAETLQMLYGISASEWELNTVIESAKKDIELSGQLNTSEKIIADAICSVFNVTMSEIKAGIRGCEIVCDARKALCFEIKNRLKYSDERIGEICNRDHSSVSIMRKRFNDIYDADSTFRAKMKQVKSIINERSELAYPNSDSMPVGDSNNRNNRKL